MININSLIFRLILVLDIILDPYREIVESSIHINELSAKMAIDFQLQIYLLGGIFGIIVILLIFVLAALCGKLERFEMKAREQQREWDKWVNFRCILFHKI